MYKNDKMNPANPLNASTQDKVNNTERSTPTEIFIGIEKHCFLKEKRVFDRRTRRDRRRVWKNPKFKGPDKRRFKRRCAFNRRQVEVSIDDLGKNIP